MLVGGVVDDQLGEHADAARVRRVEEALEVVERAVDRVDRRVVGDVVAVVAERRRVEGQQPEAGDAEIAAGRGASASGPAKSPMPSPLLSVEGADVRFVDDRVLVPERVGASLIRLPDRRRCAPCVRPDRAARSSTRRATCSARRRAGPRRRTAASGGMPSSADRHLDPAVLHVVRVGVGDDEHAVASPARLAEPEQRVVVGRVERAAWRSAAAPGARGGCR